MIDIHNIVNVDFKIIKSTSSIGSYKTVAYLIPDVMMIGETTHKAVLCESYDEVANIKFSNQLGEAQYNAKQFFDNGGVQLLFVTVEAYTLDGFKAAIDNARIISNDFIYVCINNTICDNDTLGFSTSVLVEIASYVETLKAPETIRLLLTKDISTSSDGTVNYDYINTFKDYSVAVKFCSKKRNELITDAALLIGAYFSKISLDDVDTIKDYCYTPEVIIDDTNGKNIASENVNQSMYSKLIAGNYNFIDTIGNKIINFGGNLSNGISISVDFATICLENDVCTATLNSLIGKQYLSETGLTNIISVINTKLERYIDNGYLRKNSSYSGNDLNIRYNGRSYKVLKNGDMLENGYYIFAVPVSDISVEDKENKKFPPIYVVVESLAGARTVTINGEVR